jgi:AcrR family transcriptional regulator
MTAATPPARLAIAAFELFAEQGYEGTTVEAIAERAGTSRATFFRHYRSKEDVIFPDHQALLDQVRARLESSSHQTALAAVGDAVRLVLLHYVAEGERARIRYGLTSSVPALRDREIASVAAYQRLFRGFISAWMGDDPDAALRAELMSAAVVAAHNHVLRRWLRGECRDPAAEVDRAMGRVMALFSTSPEVARQDSSDSDGATFVVAFRSGRGLEGVVSDLEELLNRA